MTMALRAHGVDVTEFPPVVMSMIVASLARIVLLERGLGITPRSRRSPVLRRALSRPLRDALTERWAISVTQVALTAR